MKIMDFTKLKQLVRQNGDRLILVDHEEPEAVVLSFAEYERLAGGCDGECNCEHARNMPAAASVVKGDATPRVISRFSEKIDSGDDVNAAMEAAKDQGMQEDPFSSIIPAEVSPSAGRKRSPIGFSDMAIDQEMPVALEDIRLEDLPL